ncbi:hypothetical protein UCREL1_6229 [Eutypa lata UCREL1]|uniref:Uncharacterized protein n=1 Tax=Eutypa lata (strain UCR-EL1) TaxID=1287681 RepID=M7TA91_EUTLA|nr:hypothetical protein UCREL1_6229 [Eutypa lata UCREL1]
MLGDPLQGMYADVATGLARVDHFVVLICAAIVLYAFLMVELLKEVLQKEERGKDGGSGGGEGDESDYYDDHYDGYDDKDDISLVKQALGLERGRRKRLDSMV